MCHLWHGHLKAPPKLFFFFSKWPPVDQWRFANRSPLCPEGLTCCPALHRASTIYNGVSSGHNGLQKHLKHLKVRCCFNLEYLEVLYWPIRKRDICIHLSHHETTIRWFWLDMVFPMKACLTTTSPVNFVSHGAIKSHTEVDWSDCPGFLSIRSMRHARTRYYKMV